MYYRLTMITTVSTKGQVVIPSEMRRRLGIRPGDRLEARIDARHLVLLPYTKAPVKPHMTTSKKTGLPVASAPDDKSVITSKMVRDAMSEFP
jgi:AbrB family looped-hinge helix DNA binding protein